jgi:hypothetical protein
MKWNILIVLIGLCYESIAQPYYSRSLHDLGPLDLIYTTRVHDDGSLFISHALSISNPDPEKNGIYGGIVVLNDDWSDREYIAFPKGWRPFFKDNMVLHGDSIITLIIDNAAHQARKFHIRGYSKATRDSIFDWNYKLDHIPNGVNWRIMNFELTKEGYYVIAGQYETNGPNSSGLCHYFLLEIGMDGQILRRNDRLFTQLSRAYYLPVFAIRLLSDKDHYYLKLWGETREGVLVAIVAIDRVSMEINWRWDASSRIIRSDYIRSLSFSRDSTELYVGYMRRLRDDEDQWEELPYEEWLAVTVPEIVTLDPKTGELKRELFEYRLAIDSLHHDIICSMTSRLNGDVYLAGQMIDGHRYPQPDPMKTKIYNGMLMRVDPREGFKWTLSVIDEQPGYRFVFGYTINDIQEAANGDILMMGLGINNEVFNYGAFAWVMRIGPDGCANWIAV